MEKVQKQVCFFSNIYLYWWEMVLFFSPPSTSPSDTDVTERTHIIFTEEMNQEAAAFRFNMYVWFHLYFRSLRRTQYSLTMWKNRWVDFLNFFPSGWEILKIHKGLILLYNNPWFFSEQHWHSVCFLLSVLVVALNHRRNISCYLYTAQELKNTISSSGGFSLWSDQSDQQ